MFSFFCRKEKRYKCHQNQQGRNKEENVGRQVGRQTVAVEDLAVVLDDRIGDERRYDPRDQNKEDDTKAFKLSLGFFREELDLPPL